MENALDGAIVLIIILSMSFLAIVAVFSAFLVLSTIPKRDRDR